MKIILFGSTGNLGKNLHKYLLLQGYTVYCIDRKTFDVETENWEQLCSLLNEKVKPDDVLINCVGFLPHPQHTNPRKFIAVNTLFPQEIHKWAKKENNPFLHLTTAAVYSGIIGGYNENSSHDATDLFGITKSAGEDPTMCVLRSGVLGYEEKGQQNVLEWLCNQKPLADIQGNTNIRFNGLTYLELAKQVEYVVRTRTFWRGVRHIHSPFSITQYDLFRNICDICNLNVTIQRVCRIPNRDFTLSTLYTSYHHQEVQIPTIPQQIREQHVFMQRHFCLQIS